jgi:tRNA-splicing ligase RtcB
MIEQQYEVTKVEGGVPVKTWTRGVAFEEDARRQLINISKMPFIHRWVAAMPDVHLGKGATIGSVIPTLGAIIPAAVGVDIGCGMMAVKTSLRADQLPDNLAPLRSAIESAVPHGRTPGKTDRGSWNTPPAEVDRAWAQLAPDFAAICARHPAIAKSNHHQHLSTLGTGNHFIEICLDETDGVWEMLHSGSRGVGNRIGTYFIELANNDMEQWLVHLQDKVLA